eukprot:4862054-Pyramimonas_sp.AAC.1
MNSGLAHGKLLHGLGDVAALSLTGVHVDVCRDEVPLVGVDLARPLVVFEAEGRASIRKGVTKATDDVGL